MSLAFPFLLLLSGLAAHADARLEQARANGWMERGRYRKAAEAYRKLLEQEPGRPAYELGLGRALAGSHHCEAALPYLTRNLGAPAYRGRDALAGARCAVALGEPALAAELLEDALRFEPDDRDRLHDIAWTAVDADAPRLFAEARQRFLAAGGGLGRALLLDARVALARGDTDAVFALLQDARDLGFAGRDAAWLEARAWMLLDEPAIAADTARAALREERDDLDMACTLAEARRRAGEPGRGGAVLSVTIRSQADAPCREATLARIGLDRGRPDAPARAAALLDAHPVLPEAVATAWYAARHAGDTAGMDDLATRYAAVARPEDGPLELLVPIDQRTP